MDTLPFIIASRKIKYLEINLIKDVNDLYNENFKPLKEEIEKDTRKYKSHVHGLEELI